MKPRFLILLISCGLFLLACLFFPWVQEQAAVPTPVPSVSAGFYQEPFLLELSAPGNGTIYYTTDGSTPTADSQVYRDGIYIQDRSQEPNLYQSQQRVVADWKTYTPNNTPVEKGTVIRAIFINQLGGSSPVLTQTYFVGVEPPDSGYVLSVVFEPEDMFGENGIYVTGTAYDAWYLSGGDPDSQHDRWYEAKDSLTPETLEDSVPNFFKHLEIPVLAELMDSGGDVMNQNTGLRIQGNSTRLLAKKAMTLTAREEYSGSDVFDSILFPGVTTHSVMTKVDLTDVIVGDLVSDRWVATQDSIPVRIYLNGEYWLNCYLLERYDTHYFRQHYHVDDRVLVKDGVMDEESRANTDIDYYSEYTYWVSTTDFTDPDNWEQFLQETDLQSYIDFMVINYYLCNIDFSDYFNYVVWRCALPGSGTYEDLRWRWCIYDIGALEWIPGTPSLGKAEALNLFSQEHAYSQTILYQALKPNQEFRRQFVLTFMDMVNNNFAPENVEPVLAKYGQTLDWMDGFFRNRPDYAVAYLAEEFDLTGEPQTITISASQPQGGSVVVNTSRIDLSSGSWSGQYFADYPITVTAVPAEGYQFAGWKGDTDETAQTISLTVNRELALEAVFVEQ